MDCVVHQFDYEVPYKEKKDIPMDLEYLNGFDEDFEEFDDLQQVGQIESGNEGLLLEDDLYGLEGKQERQAKREAKREAGKPTFVDRLKKTAHIVNKVNPATALLRAGILASMKINLMNVGAKLRYSYWSEPEALRNNMEQPKYRQLLAIREKLEKIFFGAGGKPENLKNAILTGRGNRDKRIALNGLGEVVSYVTIDDDLEQILGLQTYEDEFLEVENESGINGLGSISASAAIASATGVIGTIAALLKKLGELFKKGSPQSQQEIILDNSSVENSKISPEQMADVSKYLAMTEKALTTTAGDKRQETKDLTIPVKDGGSEGSNLPMVDKGSENDSEEDKSKALPKPPEGTNKVFEWIKDNPWKTAALGLTLVGGVLLAVKAFKKSKQGSMNGLSGHEGNKAGRKKNKSKRGSKYGDIPTVELM